MGHFRECEPCAQACPENERLNTDFGMIENKKMMKKIVRDELEHKHVQAKKVRPKSIQIKCVVFRES